MKLSKNPLFSMFLLLMALCLVQVAVCALLAFPGAQGGAALLAGALLPGLLVIFCVCFSKLVKLLKAGEQA